MPVSGAPAARVVTVTSGGPRPILDPFEVVTRVAARRLESTE